MMNPRQAIRVFAVALGALAGCAPQVTIEPAQDHNEYESLDFIHLLAQQPMVTYDQGCRAMLLLADGQEEQPGVFEQRHAELLSRGAVSDRWDLTANDPLDRGTLAYMMFKVCRMPHSLSSWLSGFSGLGDRRYALKNVVHAGVMPYGLPGQIPTGGEVVAALARADDYMAAHGVYQADEVEVVSPSDVDRGGAGQP